MYPRLNASPRTPDTRPLAPAKPKATKLLADEDAPQVLEQAAEAASLEVRFEPPAEGLPARASVSVELLCENTQAQIFYALGADVNESSEIYTPGEPLILTRTTQVSARAWLGGESGPLASALFRVERPQWEQREPLERSDPTPHQDARDFDFGDGWLASAASVRGKLHAHRALWREDSFAVTHADSPSGTWAILVAADGAGSAALSRVGSRLACDSVARSLQQSLATQDLSADAETLKARDLPDLRGKLVGAAHEALQVLEAESKAREKPLSQFATTLLVLVRRAWGSQDLCAALQVGDGAVALLNGDGLLTILGQADHGEHSSETRFLTTPGIAEQLEGRAVFSLRSGLAACAVMTDGVSDDFFPEAQRLPAALSQVLERAQSSEAPSQALLSWLGYEKKGSSDDRTLIITWRTPEAGGAAP